MATIRKIDFSKDIIQGEKVIFDFSADSVIDIVDSEGTKTTYSFPYQPIDTSDWKTGAQTAIINDSGFEVRVFQVVDPTATASKYNQYMKIIDEINIVISSKVENGGVITQSINNKSLTTESLDALHKLRAHYTKLANQEYARMKGIATRNPIKSVTTFNRGT